jgi:transposase InsO family protein
VAKAVQEWIAAVGAKSAYIERGSPWENGYIESFNARLRDELLDGEIFYSLREARIVIESWQRSGRMPQSDTSHQHRRCSSLPSPRGRLSYDERLRRPRWRNGQH